MRRQQLIGLIASVVLAVSGLVAATFVEDDEATAGRASVQTDGQGDDRPSPPVTTGAPPESSTSTSSPPTPTAPQPALAPGTGVLISPNGVVVPVVGGAPGAWEVRTPCNQTATLAEGTAVGRATVVLDPGHGGAEPGAVSPGGLAEKGVNLAVSLHAKQALEREGVDVVLTRTADYSVSLPARGEIARNLRPRAFVSVHHNAEPDEPRDIPGSETYYQIASPESKRLAGLLYEEVLATLSGYDVAWVGDFDAGAKYRPGSRGDYYAVLRLPGADVTSVLVESAFISNPDEADLVSRSDVQKAEGEALARGILRYLRSADPGSGFVEPYPRPDPPGSGTVPPCVDPPL